VKKRIRSFACKWNWTLKWVRVLFFLNILPNDSVFGWVEALTSVRHTSSPNLGATRSTVRLFQALSDFLRRSQFLATCHCGREIAFNWHDERRPTSTAKGASEYYVRNVSGHWHVGSCFASSCWTNEKHSSGACWTSLKECWTFWCSFSSESIWFVFSDPSVLFCRDALQVLNEKQSKKLCLELQSAKYIKQRGSSKSSY